VQLDLLEYREKLDPPELQVEQDKPDLLEFVGILELRDLLDLLEE
jgi:hypothetical protein